jgi:hypothetical protein
MAVLMSIVWVVYAENPGILHAVRAVGGILCGKEYVNGVEGPFHELPNDGVAYMQCGLCFSALGTPMKIAKYKELSDEELATMEAEALCKAYKELRAHHITETMALINRRNGICPHQWTQWQWSDGGVGGYHRHCVEPGCAAREFSRFLQPMGLNARTG